MAKTKADESTESMSSDEKIIQEAKDRFKRAFEWEGDFRKLYVADVKFSNGDSDNGWQWPHDLKRDRDVNARPCLTINKTQQHVLRITNDGRKNPPAVRIKPTTGEGTFEAAQTWEGLIRNIEYESSAQVVYVNAAESQVEGGIGYWRINHGFVDEGSFDQRITIEPVIDQLGVLLDCDIKQRDGSDAKWGFVYEDVNKDEFEREYPDVDLPSTGTFALSEVDDWITTDKVRIAEYYRITEFKDELVYLETPDGEKATFKKSEIPEKWRKVYRQAVDDRSNMVRHRPIKRKQLEWYKIAGAKIIGRRGQDEIGEPGVDSEAPLKGQYIPIVRLPGREKRIDGKLERKGLVRALKDPQRMYNYNNSGQVEFGALQTKTPWVIAAAAIEGNQSAWNDANTKNAAYLTYKHMDAQDRPIPPPQRNEPPGASPAFQFGIQVAAADLEMASGQYAPQQQNPMLERTPAAVDQRERMGETATYDFIYNLSMAIRYTAIIILDLAPHIYDTERLIKILDPDGTQREITIDPSAPKPYSEKKSGDTVEAIFNPTMGRYGVQADIGPAYGTRRQEAWNAFSSILQAKPELLNIIGDLAFQTSDFFMADKIAERIKRMIKATTPWLLDDQAPTPQMQQLQQQNQSLQQQVAEMLEKLAEYRIKLKGKDELRDIEASDAENRRFDSLVSAIKELHGMNLSENEFGHQLMKTLHDMDQTELTNIQAANKDAISGGDNGGGGNAPQPQQQARPTPGPASFHPSVIGAKQAPDGHWYVKHHGNEGKYLRVHHRG